MIRVQREDFDVGAELEGLVAGDRRIGGIASFVGVVREMGGADAVAALTLEHYPGMTEKKLAEIERDAQRRWPLAASLIIHRYGRLEPGDRIVLVATASAAPRGRTRRLPFPDRLVENRGAVLEKRRDRRGPALGCGARRGRCRQGPLVVRRHLTRCFTGAGSGVRARSARTSRTAFARRPSRYCRSGRIAVPPRQRRRRRYRGP